MIGDSPIRYFEKLFLKLIENGYQLNVSTEILTINLKKLTGTMNPKKIRYYIKTLEEFGYITLKKDGYWLIKWDKLIRDYPDNEEFKKMKLLLEEQEQDIIKEEDKFDELVKK